MEPRRLRCSVQNYEWGCRADDDSAVARLFSRNVSAEIDKSLPYAEFWMGTHDSGPSFVLSDLPDLQPVSLKSWILQNPTVLGYKVVQRWGIDLPFLFKVLSVEKALSIQAHPDLELAKLLHHARPDVYKDANHKPEMAIAVTEFKALCSFVSIEELKSVLSVVPEIKELVGSEEANKYLNLKEHAAFEEVMAILKSMYTRLMTANKELVSEVVTKLHNRLNAESKIRSLTEKEELILLLEKQYPADVGVVSAFFFNFVKLKPGEALYLGANEPHAYISGECIECMATSDNVVRAGLTPKYKDVETLCSMLTYKQGFPEILHGERFDSFVLRYSPPFDEFEVDHISIPQGEMAVLPSSLGPSIFVVMAGKGKILHVGAPDREEIISHGHVIFLPAGTEMKIFSIAVGADHPRPLDIYRAGVNGTYLSSTG